MRELDCVVQSNLPIAENIFEMSLAFEESLPAVRGGQFLNVILNRPDMVLPRPFGICGLGEKSASFCYQVVGGGTEFLSGLEKGHKLRAVLPLGNGFELGGFKRVAAVGGGVGVFPLYGAALTSPGTEITAFLGYKSAASVCYADKFKEKGVCVNIATDDGSLGFKGNAVELFFQSGARSFDAVIACGPKVMLKALKERCKAENLKVPVFVSLEERMGCGIGACLVCTCKAEGRDKRLRVCKDGPVFRIDEVEI